MFKNLFNKKIPVSQRLILDESYFNLQKAKDEAWGKMKSREAIAFFASRLNMIQNKILVLIGLGLKEYDLNDFYDHVFVLGEFGDEVDEDIVKELIADYCTIKSAEGK